LIQIEQVGEPLADRMSLQLGPLAACWLAAHDPCLPSATATPLLFDVMAHREERELIDTWRRLNALQTLRTFSRRKKDFEGSIATRSLVPIKLQRNEVWWKDVRLGWFETLFQRAIPQEAQTRVAYETFLYRFRCWLEEHCRILSLGTFDAITLLFIPDLLPSPDVTAEWQAFVRHAFSIQELQHTFVLLLNSIQLTDNGFSVPDLPIVTQDQADILLALLVETLQTSARRIQSLELEKNRHLSLLADLEQTHAETPAQALEKQRLNAHAALAKLDTDLNDLHARYDQSLARLKALLAQLRITNPARAHRIHLLARGYTAQATRQLKVTGSIIELIVERIKELLALSPDDLFMPAPLLSRELPIEDMRVASDAARGVCYACGEGIPLTHKRYKKKYTASRLIFQDPSQTLQSRPPEGKLRQVQPEVCGRCAVLAMVCPVKMVDAGLVISLREKGIPETAGHLYEHRLRGLTVGEQLTAAGRYLMIPCKERALDNKPLIKRLGRKEYALLKVAALFPADVLSRFQVEAFFGTDPILLKSRHLVTLRFLLDVFSIHFSSFRTKEDRPRYMALVDAIRYLERDHLVFALYRLMLGFQQQNTYSTTQRTQLEDGLKMYQERLEMDGETTIAQRFRDVVGLTGILYAFISRAKKTLQDTPNSRQRDPNRELKKLIEQVDHPLHFTYEAAGTLRGQMAQIWRSPQTYFIYDEAKRLLHEVAQISIDERETMPSNEDPVLKLYYEDICKIYTGLFECRYPTEKEQRDFTYELKLSLYTHFPELRPGNQKD